MNFTYENYRIKGGSHSWELQKIRTRRNKQTKQLNNEWESFQWYNSLQGAVNALVEHRVRTLEAETLAEALNEVKRIATALSQALTPKFELTVKGVTQWEK